MTGIVTFHGKQVESIFSFSGIKNHITKKKVEKRKWEQNQNN